MPRPSTPGLRTRAVAVCAVLALAYVLLPGPWRGAVTALASALLTLVVARRLRTGIPDAAPWRLVLAAAVTLTVHNVESVRHTALLGRVAGSGPLHDLTLPLGYALVLVAALLVISRYAGRDTGGVVEAGLVGLGVALLLWVLLLGPALTARATPRGERLYDLVVTLILSGIAGAVLHAVRTSRAARPALLSLLVAAVVTLAGTVVGVLAVDPVTGGPVWWLDLLWIAAYVAIATAAADPSLPHLSRDDRPVPTRLTGGRIALLGAVLALGPLLAAVQQARGQPADAALVLLGSVLVVPLVILRVAGLARLHAATQAALTQLATVDVLTDLPNRRAIDRHLAAALDRTRRSAGEGLVVLFLDLDDLRVVNDAHGHRAGDELLGAVARLLRTALPADVLVGRLGGDEFVVAAEGDPATLRETLVTGVESALGGAVDVGPVVTTVRASIGVAEVRPGEDVTPARLLATADARMYERKRAARVTDVDATAVPGPRTR